MIRLKRKLRYSWEIRESWSTEYDGNSYHTHDIIAFNSKQVDKWLHNNYNLENSQDASASSTELVYDYSARYSVSDHGNLIEVDQCDECDKEDFGTCENHFYQTDSITAFRDEKPLTEENYKYLKSGQHWTSVIDLTEN